MANDNPWSALTPVPGAGTDSREPALAVIGDTLHLAWSRSRTLYHATFDGKTWSAPVRIASGEQPALAVTPDGRLHCLFTHKFIGNDEVYYTTLAGSQWSLPEPVSRTPGVSTNPAIAVGSGRDALRGVGRHYARPIHDLSRRLSIRASGRAARSPAAGASSLPSRSQPAAKFTSHGKTAPGSPADTISSAPS